VLSFSRLFGPGKPSSLPQIWRGARKRRRRKAASDGEDADANPVASFSAPFPVRSSA